MKNGPPLETVAEAWQSFSISVIPKNAPKVQKREMQLAFYSGVHAILCMMRRLAACASEDEGINIVLDWQKECSAFKDEFISQSESSQR